MQINFKKSASYIAGCATVLGVSAVPSMAQFAHFDQAVIAGTRPFTFTNTGSTSTFTADVDVNFNYKVANGYNPSDSALQAATDIIAGHLTLSADVDGFAYTNGGRLDQNLKNIVIEIRATNKVNNQDLLLRTVATSATFDYLEGPANSTKASLNVYGDPATQISYFSDFLDFSGIPTDRSFGFTLESLDPRLAKDLNGYLKSFKADGSGDFAQEPTPPSTVPEPGAVATGVIMASMMGMCLVRGRRRSKSA